MNGGLRQDSGDTTDLHSATWSLHWTLREVLAAPLPASPGVPLLNLQVLEGYPSNAVRTAFLQWARRQRAPLWREPESLEFHHSNPSHELQMFARHPDILHNMWLSWVQLDTGLFGYGWKMGFQRNTRDKAWCLRNPPHKHMNQISKDFRLKNGFNTSWHGRGRYAQFKFGCIILEYALLGIFLQENWIHLCSEGQHYFYYSRHS